MANFLKTILLRGAVTRIFLEQVGNITRLVLNLTHSIRVAEIKIVPAFDQMDDTHIFEIFRTNCLSQISQSIKY